MISNTRQSYRRRKYRTVARVAPSNFVADLQHLRNWPMMKGSLWRNRGFVELTHKYNAQLLSRSITGRNLKILDIGCGTGVISLQLARRGHDVLGLDHNEKMIQIANRTKKKTGKIGNGKLEYELADFDKWTYPKETYDIVLFSRVLHDLPKPEKILLKVHRLLKNGGKIVCLEYAYDMIDKRAALWLYHIRRMLEILGLYASPHLPDNAREGVEHIMGEATIERKEHINTFREMIRPLKRLFHQETFTWHPYYFWDVLSDMRIANPRIETRLGTMISDMEKFLLRTREIPSVLFLYKGTRKS